MIRHQTTQEPGIGVFQFSLSALEGQARYFSYQPLPQQLRQVQSPTMALAVVAVVFVVDIATRRIGLALQPCGLPLE